MPVQQRTRRAASCRVARSCPPLAVPMMYNTMDTSVSRHDAQIITEQRLARLKTLSESKEDELTNEQNNEKQRIIRLEKNRRAAASSRRKKKNYVKNLEDNAKLMSRHISILELENAHLRAMLRGAMATSFPGPVQFRGMPPVQPFNPSASSSGSTTPIAPPSKRSQSCGLPMDPNQQMRGQSPPPILQPLPLPGPPSVMAPPAMPPTMPPTMPPAMPPMMHPMGAAMARMAMPPNMQPMHPHGPHPGARWAASAPPPMPPPPAPYQNFPVPTALTPEIGQMQPAPVVKVKAETRAETVPVEVPKKVPVAMTPKSKSKQSRLFGAGGELRFRSGQKPRAPPKVTESAKKVRVKSETISMTPRTKSKQSRLFGANGQLRFRSGAKQVKEEKI